MAEPLEAFRHRLQRHKQSVTTPRLTIFSTLQTHGPLTMHELVDYCGPSVDRASIYRSIKLFEQLGIIQRLQIGWKYRIELSSDFQNHHHHMHCVSCGRVTAIPEDPLLEDRLHELSKSLHFEAQDHQIEIRGLCRSCQPDSQSN